MALRYSFGRPFTFLLKSPPVMKVRIALSLTVLAALSACANVKDVRDRDPVFYGSTQRTAEAYTTCVASAWKNMGVNFQQKAVRDDVRAVEARDPHAPVRLCDGEPFGDEALERRSHGVPGDPELLRGGLLAQRRVGGEHAAQDLGPYEAGDAVDGGACGAVGGGGHGAISRTSSAR